MDIEQIRQKKLAELQSQLANQPADQHAQMEQMKRTVLVKMLTKEARERLNTVRTAHPELVEQVELSLLQAAQYGQFKEQVTDIQLKNILSEVVKTKKEFRIVRK